MAPTTPKKTPKKTTQSTPQRTPLRMTPARLSRLSTAATTTTTATKSTPKLKAAKTSPSPSPRKSPSTPSRRRRHLSGGASAAAATTPSKSSKTGTPKRGRFTIHLVNQKTRKAFILPSIEVSSNWTVGDVRRELLPFLSKDRIKLSLANEHTHGLHGGTPNIRNVGTSKAELVSTLSVLKSDSSTLAENGIRGSCTIFVKDLGPQIGWRSVFLLEYLGPLLIHHFVLLGRLHYDLPRPSWQQLLGYSMITFHFLKREYETLFVHRFSHSTMPFMNLFKNCAHYWILSGVAIAIPLYSPSYKAPANDWVVIGSAVVFVLAEIANYYTHLVLRNLRPEGSSLRSIPRGPAFALISCPNYLFEGICWVSFSAMTGLWTSYLFTVIALIQMYLWAVKKHSQYRKEFPSYPKNRRALIPFLL